MLEVRERKKFNYVYNVEKPQNRTVSVVVLRIKHSSGKVERRGFDPQPATPQCIVSCNRTSLKIEKFGIASWNVCSY